MKHMRLSKNKIRTNGYFVKRLRDSGFVVLKIFNRYGKHDPRRWTVLIDPSGASVFITCLTNKEKLNDVLFELHDSGVNFATNYSIQTDSIEVMLSYLIKRGVSNVAERNSVYTKNHLNNINEEGQKF